MKRVLEILGSRRVGLSRRRGALTASSAVLGGIMLLFLVGVLPARAIDPKERGGYAFEVDLTIGGPDAPDPAQFYERISQTQVEADASGNLYVLDDGNHRVQIFDASGRFLRSVGREGEGPGEFTMPSRISVNGPGDFAVFDMGQQRISIFDAQGVLLRDQVVPGMVADFTLLDDRSLVYATRSGYVESVGPGGEAQWSAGEPRPPGGREVQLESDYDTVATRLAPGPDGSVLAASSAEYRVRVLSEGSETAIWTRQFERQPFEFEPPKPSEDGEGGPVVVMIRREEGGGGSDGASGETSAQSWSADAGDGEVHTFDMNELQNMMPEFVSDIRGMLAWPDGRTWVVTSRDQGDTMVTDEWFEDGTYLRRFTIPKQWQSFSVGADGRLYAVAHDDDGYPIVNRLQVSPAR